MKPCRTTRRPWMVIGSSSLSVGNIGGPLVGIVTSCPVSLPGSTCRLITYPEQWWLSYVECVPGNICSMASWCIHCSWDRMHQTLRHSGLP